MDMSVIDWLNKLVQIPGRLTSVAIEKVVCGADEVYDDTLEKRQSELNAGFLNGTNETVELTEDIIFDKEVSIGEQKTVIYLNDTNDVLTVTVPNNVYRTPDGEVIPIEIPSGGYGEVNIININGTIFARGC